MSDPKAKRAERRRRSRVVSQRRLKKHLKQGGHEVEPLSWMYPQCSCKCPGDSSAYYYSKRTLACSCSKRKKGAPRRGSGMCDPEDRKRIYKWRKEARELKHLVCFQLVDPEEDLVSLLT